MNDAQLGLLCTVLSARYSTEEVEGVFIAMCYDRDLAEKGKFSRPLAASDVERFILRARSARPAPVASAPVGTPGEKGLVPLQKVRAVEKTIKWSDKEYTRAWPSFLATWKPPERYRDASLRAFNEGFAEVQEGRRAWVDEQKRKRQNAIDAYMGETK